MDGGYVKQIDGRIVRRGYGTRELTLDIEIQQSNTPKVRHARKATEGDREYTDEAEGEKSKIKMNTKRH